MLNIIRKPNIVNKQAFDFVISSIVVSFVVFNVAEYDDINKIVKRADDYSQRQSNRQAMGIWLNEYLSECDSYMLGDVGMAGYTTKSLDIIDAYCLNNTDMTSPAINKSIPKFVDLLLNKAPKLGGNET